MHTGTVNGTLWEETSFFAAILSICPTPFIISNSFDDMREIIEAGEIKGKGALHFHVCCETMEAFTTTTGNLTGGALINFYGF